MTAQSNYQLTTLKNGIRVATESLPGLETAAVTVTMDVGARYEAPSENGISHMLEHMAFKGTERRSALAIAEEFDEIGGNFNAYTSLEQTVYYARTLKNDVPVAMDILGDILQNSAFDQEELEKERHVIIQEIAMNQDAPDELVFDYFHETAFPGQALGRSILGTNERIKNFKRDDLFSFMQRHYTPPQMIISAAGNVDHAAICDLAEQHFSLMPKADAQLPEPGSYKGGDLRRQKKLEQLHIMLGFPGVAVHDKDYYAYQLLATIMGGGMSSRLFQEVREKRGLAYTVQSFVSAYDDAGLFGIYLATGEDKAGEIMPVLADEMHKATQQITEAELRRAKNQQKASLLMARESSTSVAEWIGRNLLVYGEYQTAQQITDKIERVSIEEVKRAAQTMLKASLPTIAALGPLGKLESYDRVKETFAL